MLVRNTSIAQIITTFMQLSTQDVVGFLQATFKDAVFGGQIGRDAYLYRPGKPGSPLLVAHVDTVWGNRTVEPVWIGDTLVAGSGTGTGIGADDRAGVAAVWWLGQEFPDAGLLFPDMEESGCVGATKACLEIGDELAQHAFAIEIDRKGESEIATYGVHSEEFESYLVERLPEWTWGHGLYTDITEICPTVGISGVNFAAGYWNEHTRNECLSVPALLHTMDAVRASISDVPRNFPFDGDALGRFGVTKVWNGWNWGDEWTAHHDVEEPEQVWNHLESDFEVEVSIVDGEDVLFTDYVPLSWLADPNDCELCVDTYEQMWRQG